MGVAKKMGVPESSLPILATLKEVLQGSADIIDWAQKNTATQRNLTPSEQQKQCQEFEQRLDDVAGVHMRRYFYSEALVEHSDTVRQIFIADLPPAQKLEVTAGWPMIRELMIQKMDLGAAQGEESKQIVDRELSWLDELLADGRNYLVADQFSRVDITAAGLFARLAEPAEYFSSSFVELPPRMADTLTSWHDRPSLQWIRGIYQKHRDTP
jgi:glutathione S-transferase